MVQTIKTKKAEDLEQETSSAKMQTAKAIIWNSNEELKQVSVSSLVNNNVTKDAVPTEGSANPVESGGVYAGLGGKADNPNTVTFYSGDNLTLADNTIYTAGDAISELQILGSNGTSVISFNTGASVAITITLPLSIKFTETPTFGNNEHWEISVRNGYAVYTKYNLA